MLSALHKHTVSSKRAEQNQVKKDKVKENHVYLWLLLLRYSLMYPLGKTKTYFYPNLKARFELKEIIIIDLCRLIELNKNVFLAPSTEINKSSFAYMYLGIFNFKRLKNCKPVD